LKSVVQEPITGAKLAQVGEFSHPERIRESVYARAKGGKLDIGFARN
jgi:hypothetical protein